MISLMHMCFFIIIAMCLFVSDAVTTVESLVTTTPFAVGMGPAGLVQLPSSSKKKHSIPNVRIGLSASQPWPIANIHGMRSWAMFVVTATALVETNVTVKIDLPVGTLMWGVDPEVCD